jgi:hypothetical protein
MPDSPRHPSFSFHIEDRESETHAVPASVLANILQRAQHAFELIGVQLEGREIKSRARIPAAISDRFQLVCELPKPGSYVLPVTVGGTSGLFDHEQAQKALETFQDLTAAVSEHNVARVHHALPGASIRRRVLESIRNMAPSAEARWTLTLCDAKGQAFAALNNDAARFVDETLVPVEQREAARVVTGELKSIDFAEHKVTIIYPPTSKELACIYQEDIEDLLYDSRRDLIQVTGRVVLDDNGEPKQIINVTDIRDLDLSPFVLDSVQFGGLTLNVSPALALEPKLDDTKQLLCVEDLEVGLDAFATSRDLLFVELNEQLAMLWREYALAPDAELTTRAIARKQALLGRFAEARNAP